MPTPISIAERALGIAANIAQTGLRAAGQAVTIAQGRARSPGATNTQLNDAALARKVESELFRDPAVPKGKIDVNAVGRVVYLRGQTTTAAQVADLARRTQAIAEVERVENLLETPRMRSRAGAARRAPKRRAPSRRVNAEAKTNVGEPSPREMAVKRQGRRPAPMGSSEPKGAAAKNSASPAEPSPKTMAAKRAGRKPAPMGSSEPKGAAAKNSASPAEPSPKGMAAKRAGRKPAPMGSTDTNGDG